MTAISLPQASPQVEIDTLATDSGYIYVVRDDRLQGGTKQRAIIPFLQEKYNRGHRDFVYASPFSGFAQVALAAACARLGYQCTLFCEPDRTNDVRDLHEFSKLAASFGADVYLTTDFQQAHTLAGEYCRKEPNSLEVPLGFDCQEYKQQLSAALAVQLDNIFSTLGRLPTAFWLPVGSGTLGNVFRDLLPETVVLNCVNVRILKRADTRLQQLAERPNVVMYETPEVFSESVRQPPSIPANSFYDAKLWQFIRRHAKAGEIWWNVAR